MKILGIPVKVDVSFLIIGVLLASSRLANPVMLVEWLVVLFVSVLVHEFGHALTCRAFGLQPEVQLYGMGGLTSWREDREVSPPKRIAISLAGPFAGFFFGGLVFLLSRTTQIFHQSEFGNDLFLDLLWVNWGWGIFNLLPVLPLDGGNVVSSLEEWITHKTAGVIARTLSFLVAAGMALWAFSASLTWIAILMGWFAFMNASALYRQWQYLRDRNLRSPLEQAHADFQQRNGNAVVQSAQEILQASHSDAMKREAMQLLLQGLLLRRNLPQAQETAARLQAEFGAEAVAQALIRFTPEEWADALPVLQTAYQSSLLPELGMMYAQGLIGANRFTEALSLIAEEKLSEYATGLYALLQDKALQAKEYDLSIAAGEQALARGASPHLAYYIACAHAQAGRLSEGVTWLKQTVEAGFLDDELLADDPNIAPLRSLPEFAALAQEVAVQAAAQNNSPRK